MPLRCAVVPALFPGLKGSTFSPLLAPDRVQAIILRQTALDDIAGHAGHRHNHIPGELAIGPLPLTRRNIDDQFRRVPGPSKRVVNSMAIDRNRSVHHYLIKHANIRDDECKSGAALPL
jgi:hypothetical protein